MVQIEGFQNVDCRLYAKNVIVVTEMMKLSLLWY